MGDGTIVVALHSVIDWTLRAMSEGHSAPLRPPRRLKPAFPRETSALAEHAHPFEHCIQYPLIGPNISFWATSVNCLFAAMLWLANGNCTANNSDFRGIRIVESLCPITCGSPWMGSTGSEGLDRHVLACTPGNSSTAGHNEPGSVCLTARLVLIGVR
jgi:hypothetical protein